jgi:hypothetical protein
MPVVRRHSEPPDCECGEMNSSRPQPSFHHPRVISAEKVSYKPQRSFGFFLNRPPGFGQLRIPPWHRSLAHSMPSFGLGRHQAFPTDGSMKRVGHPRPTAREGTSRHVQVDARGRNPARRGRRRSGHRKQSCGSPSQGLALASPHFLLLAQQLQPLRFSCLWLAGLLKQRCKLLVEELIAQPQCDVP